MYSCEQPEYYLGPVVYASGDPTMEIGFLVSEYLPMAAKPRHLFFCTPLELQAHAQYMGGVVLLGKPPELLNAADFLMPREQELLVQSGLAPLRDQVVQRTVNKALVSFTHPGAGESWGNSWAQKPGKA